MRVLVAYRYELVNTNLFVNTLVDDSRKLDIEIDCSVDIFWQPNVQQNYDIIHIHWPEELFKWKSLDEQSLACLERKLSEIKHSGCKIVYTRHNSIPHYIDNYLIGIYRLIENFSDAIVHMGEFSLNEYQCKYPDTSNTQLIIPHHIYDHSFEKEISTQAARRKLKIPEDRKVILSFGKFRNRDEIYMVLKAFLKADVKNKYLVAPRMLPFEKKPTNYKLRNRFLSFVGYYFVRPLSAIFKMKLGSEKEVIKDEDVSFYFAAADVVLIQRKQILNSGNVPTAFLFKKVVVGPDTGNVGEILKDTGNPTFNSTEDRTITNALEKAFLLEKQGLGEKNYNYACQNWNIQKVAGEYKKVYKYLTNMLS